MNRRYYSSRTTPQRLNLEELYWKLKNVYLLFRDRDYFKEKAGITENELPEAIKREAAIALNFQPFPITKWTDAELSEDHVFDVIEFLYDRVSKPGEWTQMISATGFTFSDYESYDGEAGPEEFRRTVNTFLEDYKSGFELTVEGTILAKGSDGLQFIVDAEIIPYDEENVDRKVKRAIAKWRNRHLALHEKKEAIRELADVFEWLKKTRRLSTALDGKDESAIFDIATILRYDTITRSKKETMTRRFGTRGCSISI